MVCVQQELGLAMMLSANKRYHGPRSAGGGRNLSIAFERIRVGWYCERRGVTVVFLNCFCCDSDTADSVFWAVRYGTGWMGWGVMAGTVR